MSNEVEIRVGEVTIELCLGDATASLTIGESSRSSLSSNHVLAMGVVAERAMWRLEDSWLQNKAASLRDELVAENPQMTHEELKALMVETLAIGGESGDGASSSRWMLAFLQENRERPELIVRLLCELRHRQSSLSEFFMTYVYSNTDNIGANLHMLDYQRALDEEVFEVEDRELQRLAKAMLSDFRYELRIDNSSDIQQRLWSAFEEGKGTWTQEDLLAVQRLSQQLRGRHEFFGLASLAHSLRPLALYHYWHCLSLSESKAWKYVISMDRQYAAESLLPCYRVLDVCYAGLCRTYQIALPTDVPSITVSDVELACGHLPFVSDGRVARSIARYVQRDGLSEGRLEELSKALCYLESVKNLSVLASTSEGAVDEDVS